MQISPVSIIDLVRHGLYECLFDNFAVLNISAIFFSDIAASYFHCYHSLSLNCSCNHFDATLVAVAAAISFKG